MNQRLAGASRGDRRRLLLGMVGGALLLTVLFGLPLGVLLFLTGRQQLFQAPLAYGGLSFVLNIIRSVPFIILLIVLMPVTVLVTGTSLGIRGVIFPLVVGTAPFFARLVETALREVDNGLVEAAQSMGASTAQIVWKVLLPEALPGIVAGLTISFVSLTGYSAMAGAIGGGGLGDLGIRYGYQRFLPDVMLVVVIILIFFVQAIQSLGDWAVRRLSHR